MHVAARAAHPADLGQLERMYRRLEEEMTPLHPMWSRADGLAEPVDDSLAQLLDDSEVAVFLGEIDGVPVGFIAGWVEPLLPHEDEMIGAIRLVFTEPEARGVGVGEAMRTALLDDFRGRGLVRFDAHVLPGHRLVKNFFEAGGFSARSIVMHHDDERER